MPADQQVAIVGVGLLGGSIGMALKGRRLASEVVGVGRDADRLARSVGLGAVDRGTTDLAEGVRAANVVVVCTPIEHVVETVVRAAECAPSTCLVTDVASTKTTIVAEIESRLAEPPAARFVGSHPLAGDHRAGVEFARDDLLVDRTVVVTPTAHVPPESLDRVETFWESLGARVVRLSPEEHDRQLAITSHLPHLVASALAAATPREARDLIASGWCDTTRVAAADAALWRQIFASNRQLVLAALERFGQRLEELREAIAARDDTRLEQLLAEGKQIRDDLGN